jgi:GNAT superfamily N-acetyltransferase
MKIRSALESDSQKLTAISFSAKSFWPYPKSYFEIWKPELTITPEYIRENVVFIAEAESGIAGYYSLVGSDGKTLGDSKVCNLDHIYILPEFMGRKIGKSLIEHAKSVAKAKGFGEIWAVVDPHAKGFYEKVAATYIRDQPSNIPGRNIPVFKMDC